MKATIKRADGSVVEVECTPDELRRILGDSDPLPPVFSPPVDMHPVRDFGCECPPYWLGVYPPPCPTHNPGSPSIPTTTITINMPEQILTHEDRGRLIGSMVDAAKREGRLS